MKILLSILLIHVGLLIHAQESLNLHGKVKILLEENLIHVEYELGNFKHLPDDTLRLVLNNIFDIEILRYNGQEIPITKDKRSCLDCYIYSIPIHPEKPVKQIYIKGSGRYTQTAQRADYKGLISMKNDILRASEQSKWYPIYWKDTTSNPIFAKTTYTYDIELDCPKCQNVLVGNNEPINQQGRFTSEEPTDDILLIAGQYNYQVSNAAYFINLSDTLKTELDKDIQSMIQFYTELSGIKINESIIYAHLPSDNPRWLGFVTFPFIVDVSQNPNTKNVGFISHELAHFYFGKIYESKSNLYWFYLESFAEYYSYKYLLHHGYDQVIKKEFSRLKKIRWAQYFSWIHPRLQKYSFVPLKKVSSREDIHVVHRYSIGAFQLLGIEHEIGSRNMKKLIPILFQNLSEGEHGFLTLRKSMLQIGIEKKKILEIERKYFNSLRLKHYTFIQIE